jgi:hypothetical protein
LSCSPPRLFQCGKHRVYLRYPVLLKWKGKVMTQADAGLISEHLKEGLAKMERNLGKIAEQARATAAVLTPEQLQAWAISQHISAAELAAILAYTHGPAPERLFPILLRSLTDER